MTRRARDGREEQNAGGRIDEHAGVVFAVMLSKLRTPPGPQFSEQAHAGEGRVLSDTWIRGRGGVVSGEGAPARRACLLWFFLAALSGIKSRAANSGRTKHGAQK